MVRVRGFLLLVVGLVAATSCHALLPPAFFPFKGAHSIRSSTKLSRIVSWRGGAVEAGGVQPPVMNVQLGLVRVAGYGIIAGSLGLKTPQIIRVWQAKSLVGLAPASIYADVFLFATSIIYHVLKKNPIRAYGESVIVLFQTMIMVGLLWRFGTDELPTDVDDASVVTSVKTDLTKKRAAGGGTAGRVAIVAGSVAASALCFQYLPPSMWGLLVVVSTPAILAVQLPQIWKNWRQKHTGELAMLTVLLAFLGSSIRVGTTIADLGGDPWLLLNYALGSSTNAILLAQIWSYRVRTAAVRREVEARSHVAAPAA